ncbi:MAG TPA: InlB B-repeat-containing protein [Candidatus Choladousia intestinipullorum]|nr:InlB B-repeat-containing protein [Candidatus Choladousia intestinipullorum]
MKKIRKRFLGLLLTCVMVLLPVPQALAAVSYDAAAGVSGQTLFPGDSLINIGLPVMMDGAEVALETPGTWTNTDENRAFTANTSEDGASIELSAAGYVLEVEHGESKKNDESADNSTNHYEFQEGEENAQSSDIAFYQSGETVKIKADEPEEGKVFAGWTTDAEGVTFADAASAETTIVMPEKKVTVTANYQDAQTEPETPQSEESEPQQPEESEPQQPEESETPGMQESEGGSQGSEGGEIIINDPTGGETQEPGDEEIIIGDPAGDETSYSVTVNDGTGAGSYPAGTWVTVQANDRSAEGYAFTGWFVDTLNAELDDPSSSQTGFTMPEGDVTLSAQYQEITEPDTEPNTEPDTTDDITTGADDNEYADGGAGGTQPQVTTPTLTVTGGTVVEYTGTDNGSGGYNVTENTSVKIAANDPAAGKVFSGWTVTDSNGLAVESSAIGFTADQDNPLQATFTMPSYDLTITATYADTYTITVTDGSVTGGASVDGTSGAVVATEGTTVTVQAAVPSGKVFSGWTGTDANSTSISFTNVSEDGSTATFKMPASDVSITANYTDSTYSVSVTNGTLDGGAASGSYPAGSTVTVTANDPASGYAFLNWTATTQTGDAIIFADASATTTTFTMPSSAVTITANYQAVTPTHRITVSNGTINGSATDLTVDEGTQVTITANPNPQGQAFFGWSITDAFGNSVASTALGIDAYSSTITVTVNQSLNFLAQYEGVQYNLNVKKGSADYQSAVAGTVVTITADDAPDGKEFDYWEVQSGNVSLSNAYRESTTFVMPASDVTVKAHYTVTEYLVEVENGSSDQDFYEMNESVTVSSDYPASGKEFDRWEAVSGNVSFADSSRWQTSFTMPGSDVQVRATYKDGPSADSNAILEIVAGGEYYIGDTIRFTASGAGMDNTNPNPGDYRYLPTGYQIGNVTGSWNASPYTTSMSIKAAGEYTLRVTYTRQVYNGSEWASDGTTDTKSVTFRVIQKAAGVATGDDTPLMIVAAVAGVSALLFIILLVVFIRRRRRQ